MKEVNVGMIESDCYVETKTGWKWESGRLLQLAGSQLGEYKRLCEVVMMCYSEQMKLLLVALV